MSLLQFFGQIEDPHRKQGRIYQLNYVLLFCGAGCVIGSYRVRYDGSLDENEAVETGENL
jgi:hypothetical protein